MAKKDTSTPKTTAVRVSLDTSDKLKKLARKFHVTQGQLVALMVDFFKKTGYDPSDPDIAKSAISDLSKKLEQCRSNMWAAKTQFEKKANELSESNRKNMEHFATYDQRSILLLEELAGKANINLQLPEDVKEQLLELQTTITKCGNLINAVFGNQSMLDINFIQRQALKSICFPKDGRK